MHRQCHETVNLGCPVLLAKVEFAQSAQLLPWECQIGHAAVPACEFALFSSSSKSLFVSFQLEDSLAIPKVFKFFMGWLFKSRVVQVDDLFNAATTIVHIHSPSSIQPVKRNRTELLIGHIQVPSNTFVNSSESQISFIEFPLISMIVMRFQNTNQSSNLFRGPLSSVSTSWM